jgi:ketosteroid isomerase-like protein
MPQDYSRDRIELQDLMLNYAAGVDERDITRYSACFADDVEVVNFGTQTFRGREEWVAYVWSALDQYSSTQHMLGPQLATLEGDEAHTRSDVQALHFLKDSDARFTLWATYCTTMRRIQGRWLITRHELKVCGTRTD